MWLVSGLRSCRWSHSGWLRQCAGDTLWFSKHLHITIGAQNGSNGKGEGCLYSALWFLQYLMFCPPLAMLLNTHTHSKGTIFSDCYFGSNSSKKTAMVCLPTPAQPPVIPSKLAPAHHGNVFWGKENLLVGTLPFNPQPHECSTHRESERNGFKEIKWFPNFAWIVPMCFPHPISGSERNEFRINSK